MTKPRDFAQMWRQCALCLIHAGAFAASIVAMSDPVMAQTWQKTWADTLAAAKKEGAVVCGCPLHPGSRAFLQSQWARDYPEIKLEYTGARNPDWPARVEAERAAGHYLWDTFFSGPGTEVYRLAATRVFEPLLDHIIYPDVKDPKIWGGWETAFYDKDKKRMLSFWQDLTSPYYNAATVSPSEVAERGLRILLEPKFKGRIVWWDPRVSGSGANAATVIFLKLGEDGLRKILVDQEPVFVRDTTAMVERMVRGSAALSLGASLDEPLAPFAKAGVKFDIRTLGASEDLAWASAGYGIASIFNRPAHPNAAKVFVNWLLSRDIQTGLANATAQRSRRADVPTPVNALEIRPGAQYINVQREDYLEVRNSVIKLAAKFRP
ncbi:MAG: ABC transporter substrate-binding protein [Betaproteobacteria bacterium]|nr:ABC transporter substrate-binding protein [Betaproteobacteria bacterium]